MAQPFVGEIRMFAGNYAPAGWEFCAGQTLSISQYEMLFTLLGTLYGGDGTTTFRLPDLRGNLPLGQGTGPGLSARTIGQAFGSPNVTLVPSQIPAHTHTIQATNTTASTTTPGPGVLLGTTPSPNTFYDAGTANPPGKNAFAPGTIDMSGGTQPHSNLMPTASVNYIIATEGIYPMQG
ncbi:tail fiber protein [Cupriavidus necator]|uniref:phage tail protein n=1 Tax=Cupriavidus necator TaxID=106590 RepID=UPI00339D6129